MDCKIHFRQIFLSIVLFAHAPISQAGPDDLQLHLLKTIHELNDVNDRAEFEARTHALELDLSHREWNPESLRSLCATINSLTKSDQSLLLDHLPPSLYMNAQVGPCLAQAKSAVVEYHQRLQAELLQTSSESNLSQMRLHRSSLGPSVVREIDPWRGEVYATAGLVDRHVALTFDDGPHPTRTMELLEILDRQSVHATFFVNGSNVRQHPGVVNAVMSAGHTVGNHSHDHWDLARMDTESAWSNVLSGFESIWHAIGDAPRFFRFPYGSRTQSLQSKVSSEGVATFFWNIDTLDWKLRDPATLYSYVIELLEEKESGIILFHDIQQQTITVMPAVLEYLRNNGYQTVVFRVPETKL